MAPDPRWSAGRVAAAALLLAASPACAFSLRDEVSRNVHRTVPLAAGLRVEVDHRNGEVSVRARPGSEVVVDATITVSAVSKAEAESFSKAIDVEVSPGPSALVVRTRIPETPRSLFGQERVSYSVRLDVRLPAGAPLSVKSRFGAVRVEGLEAPADIDNAHGAVTLRGGRGSLRITTSFGAVDASGAGTPSRSSTRTGT